MAVVFFSHISRCVNIFNPLDSFFLHYAIQLFTVRCNFYLFMVCILLLFYYICVYWCCASGIIVKVTEPEIGWLSSNSGGIFIFTFSEIPLQNV